jgi:hypothetical protein
MNAGEWPLPLLNINYTISLLAQNGTFQYAGEIRNNGNWRITPRR